MSVAPLAGIRVIELAHVMAGPTCGRMLADLGADVIKVERPGGEDSRAMAPPWVEGESAAFLMLNRNKRGLCVDLKTAAGQQVLRDLVSTADVLIENFRMGALDRLGLGYADLSALNPRLVWCEISGFGRTGPYAAQGGYDLIVQAMAGLMHITGEGPGRPPVKVGAPVADITAGILGALGVMAALAARERTGRGQRVDTSLYEAAITLTYWQSAMALAGMSSGPMGSAHPLDAPYQAFEASDGWLAVGGANQANWLRMVDVLERPELAEDPRFKDNPARVENLEALQRALAPVFRSLSVAEWLERLSAAGVPAGPVRSVGDMLADPQTAARGMRLTVPHAKLGTVETLGFPIKLSETPAAVVRGAPVLGADAEEVLAEIGYSAETISRLRVEGVLLSD